MLTVIAAAAASHSGRSTTTDSIRTRRPTSASSSRTSVGVGVAFFAAVINQLLKLGLLSRIAERVTFVLIPPLALIFLVLGTIFLGVATPTEGGAMGATGALIMALARRRLSLAAAASRR